MMEDLLRDAEKSVPGLALVSIVALGMFAVFIVVLMSDDSAPRENSRLAITGCYVASDFPPLRVTKDVVELVGTGYSSQYRYRPSGKPPTLIEFPLSLEFRQGVWKLEPDASPRFRAAASHYVDGRRYDVVPDNSKADIITFTGLNDDGAVNVTFRRASPELCLAIS